MTAHQVQPSNARDLAVEPYNEGGPPSEWGGGQDAPPPPSGPKIARYLSALNRFKWLIGLFAVLGAVGGY
ncbi:MAG: hypothetical protein ABIW79_07225, partial [Gemmatimonas sp.]